MFHHIPYVSIRRKLGCYAIVEFVDKSVEALPIKWLTEEEDMCCWPPSIRTFSGLVKNLADPTQDRDWIKMYFKMCHG